MFHYFYSVLGAVLYTHAVFLMFGFFFSSRRRHTRCLSDWSSDVCSSDLAATARIGPGLGDAQGTLDAVKEIVRSVSLPLVVDADAIRAVAADPKCLAGKRAVKIGRASCRERGEISVGGGRCTKKR